MIIVAQTNKEVKFMINVLQMGEMVLVFIDVTQIEVML